GPEGQMPERVGEGQSADAGRMHDHHPLARGPSLSTLEAGIVQRLDPASVGLAFAPVREQALAAGSQAMDFGMLFLGFSIFLIVAALLLTALIFTFGVEQRREEIGVLLALGFTPG